MDKSKGKEGSWKDRDKDKQSKAASFSASTPPPSHRTSREKDEQHPPPLSPSLTTSTPPFALSSSTTAYSGSSSSSSPPSEAVVSLLAIAGLPQFARQLENCLPSRPSSSVRALARVTDFDLSTNGIQKKEHRRRIMVCLRQLEKALILSSRKSMVAEFKVEEMGVLLARSYAPTPQCFNLPPLYAPLLEFAIKDPRTALDKAKSLLAKLLQLWQVVDDNGWDVTEFVDPLHELVFLLARLDDPENLKHSSPNHFPLRILAEKLFGYHQRLKLTLDRNLTDRLLSNNARRTYFLKLSLLLLSLGRKSLDRCFCGLLPAEIKAENEKIISVIKNRSGRNMWELLPQAHKGLIPWDSFISSYRRTTRNKPSLAEEEQMKQLFSRCAGGVSSVTPYQFHLWLQMVGPIVGSSFTATKKLWQEKWFHPWLSPLESATFLKANPVGTFLVRFSFRKDVHFEIDFVEKEDVIGTYYVHSNMPAGVYFSVSKKFDLDTATKQASLAELIDTHPLLRFPFSSGVWGSPYFVSDLYADEAEELIRFSPPGTFVIRYLTRPSSPGGFDPSILVCTYCGESDQDASDDSGVIQPISSCVKEVGIRRISSGFLLLSQEKLDPLRLPTPEKTAKLKGISDSSLSQTEHDFLDLSFESITSFLRAHAQVLRYPFTYDNVPSLPTSRYSSSSPALSFNLRGPDKLDVGSFDEIPSLCAATTLGTYPAGSQGANILCDRYHCRTVGNRTIFALADGCNWGHRSRKAAHKACQAAVDYLSDDAVQESITTTVDAKNALHQAFRLAHTAIFQGEADRLSIGQTTLLVAMLLPLNAPQFANEEWGLVGVSVGDCKAFFLREGGEVVDITRSNRHNSRDASDSGGRLGPYVDGGLPDLRNLSSFFWPCRYNDAIVITSDGIADNMDMEHLGFLPADFGLSVPTWDQVPHQVVTYFRDRYTALKATETLDLCVGEGLSEIISTFMQHCVTTTYLTRKFMEMNPHEKEPTSYAQYPGKMDHTTAIGYHVGMEEVAERAVNSKRMKKPGRKKKPLSASRARKDSEQRKSGVGAATLSIPLLLQSVKDVVVRKYVSNNGLHLLTGPGDVLPVSYQPEVLPTGRAVGTAFSTNPMPAPSLADFFGLEVTSSRLSFVLSSGFPPSHGHAQSSDAALEGVYAASDAARATRDSFIGHLLKMATKINTTLDAATSLLEAIEVAHRAILQDADVDDLLTVDIASLGTVSLIGGLCCRLPSLEKGKGIGWINVMAAVGNCQAYAYNTETCAVEEIFRANNVSDTVTRIGPVYPDGNPNLSRVQVGSYLCTDEQNTILVLCSPVIYQCLDPAYRCVRPKMYGLIGSQKWEKWSVQRERLRCDHVSAILHENKVTTPEQAVDALYTYVHDLTKRRRSSSSTKASGVEDKQIPGVLGSNGIVAFRVGRAKQDSDGQRPRVPSSPLLGRGLLSDTYLAKPTSASSPVPLISKQWTHTDTSSDTSSVGSPKGKRGAGVSLGNSRLVHRSQSVSHGSSTQTTRVPSLVQRPPVPTSLSYTQILFSSSDSPRESLEDGAISSRSAEDKTHSRVNSSPRTPTIRKRSATNNGDGVAIPPLPGLPGNTRRTGLGSPTSSKEDQASPDSTGGVSPVRKIRRGKSKVKLISKSTSMNTPRRAFELGSHKRWESSSVSPTSPLTSSGPGGWPNPPHSPTSDT